MAKKAITIQIKNVFGVSRYYPMCDDAKAFAKIAGTTTLTFETVKLIQSLGYEVYNEVVNPFNTEGE